VKAGKLSPAEQQATLGRVRYADELAELGDAEFVIEAVVEDAEVKLEYFRRLGEHVSEEALLASNTSSIPIAGLASAVSRPDRVLGLHFFSPAPVMALVEVVSALPTSARTLERATDFVHSLGKTPIATKDRSGFIVNMLLTPYLMAAVRMLEDGFATREDIDAGMKLGCGHPMGPLTLCDFIGLDVLYAICNSLYDEFKRPEYAPPPLLKRMLVTGWLGRKSGRGFYEYTAPAGRRLTAVAADS
jgi:3-hydroxybutyryl-CoA dehydrogenase